MSLTRSALRQIFFFFEKALDKNSYYFSVNKGEGKKYFNFASKSKIKFTSGKLLYHNKWE